MSLDTQPLNPFAAAEFCTGESSPIGEWAAETAPPIPGWLQESAAQQSPATASETPSEEATAAGLPADQIGPNSSAKQSHRQRTQSTGQGIPNALNAWMQTLERAPLLLPGEEGALIAAMRRGNTAARSQLILSNLRLVFSIARQYQHGPMELPDLLQTGVLALIEAIDHFDGASGHRLSTYATCCVRRAVRRALQEQGGIIRMPINTHPVMQTIRRLTSDNPQVVDEELARQCDVSLELLNSIRAAMGAPCSLESPISAHGERLALQDLLPDAAAVPPESALLLSELRFAVRVALSRLPDLLRRVIELRYGFEDGDERRPGEIAAMLGLRPARVRQLHTDALARLRTCSPELAALETEEPIPGRSAHKVHSSYIHHFRKRRRRR